MPSETERITHGLMDRLLEEGKLAPRPGRGYTEDGDRRDTEQKAQFKPGESPETPRATAD